MTNRVPSIDERTVDFSTHLSRLGRLNAAISTKKDIPKRMASLRTLMLQPCRIDEDLQLAMRLMPVQLDDVVWEGVMHHDRWRTFPQPVIRILRDYTYKRVEGAGKAMASSTPLAGGHFNRFLRVFGQYVQDDSPDVQFVSEVLWSSLALSSPSSKTLLRLVVSKYSDHMHAITHERQLVILCDALSRWKDKSPAAITLLGEIRRVVAKRGDTFNPDMLVKVVYSSILANTETSQLLEEAESQLAGRLQQISDGRFCLLCTALQTVSYYTKHLDISEEYARRVKNSSLLADVVQYMAFVQPDNMASMLSVAQNLQLPKSRWLLTDISRILVSLTRPSVLAYHGHAAISLVEKMAVHIEDLVGSMSGDDATHTFFALAKSGMVTEPAVGLLDCLAYRCADEFEALRPKSLAYFFNGLCDAYQNSVDSQLLSGESRMETDQLSSRRCQFSRQEFRVDLDGSLSILRGLSRLIEKLSTNASANLLARGKLNTKHFSVSQLCTQLVHMRLAGVPGLLRSLADFGVDQLSKQQQITTDSLSIAFALSALGYDGYSRFFCILSDLLNKLCFSANPAEPSLDALCPALMACFLQQCPPMQSVQHVFDRYCATADNVQLSGKVYNDLLWLSCMSMIHGHPVLLYEQHLHLERLAKMHKNNGFVCSEVTEALQSAFSVDSVMTGLCTASGSSVSAVVFLDDDGQPVPVSVLPSLPSDIFSQGAEHLHCLGVRPVVLLVVEDLSFALQPHRVGDKQSVSLGCPVGALRFVVAELACLRLDVVTIPQSVVTRLASIKEQAFMLQSRLIEQIREKRKL